MSDSTTVGNYFISNYPPYSFWTPEHAGEVERVLAGPAPAGDAFRGFCRPGNFDALLISTCIGLAAVEGGVAGTTTATVVAGVATFGALTSVAVGTGLHVTFTSGWRSVRSLPYNITGVPTQLVVDAEPALHTSGTAGMIRRLRANLLDDLMDFFPLLPSSVAVPALRTIAHSVDDVSPTRRAQLLEEALMLAGHFGRERLLERPIGNEVVVDAVPDRPDDGEPEQADPPVRERIVVFIDAVGLVCMAEQPVGFLAQPSPPSNGMRDASCMNCFRLGAYAYQIQ